MKRALILHGTDDDSRANWFPWLKHELEKEGLHVWVPDLPDSSHPNIHRYTEFILANEGWIYSDDTAIIGHSSGAVEILGLLQELKDDQIVGACYLIGSFTDNLGWENLDGLFEISFNFEKIKTASRRFYFIHSDNDPYCPLDHARFLHTKIGGDLVILSGQKHFSISTAGERYKKFPYLRTLVAEDGMDIEFVKKFLHEAKNLGITIWIDGGWAVDANVGKQSRSHSDLDIVVEKNDAKILEDHLRSQGFFDVIRDDTSSWNFVLSDDICHWIDFHVIEFDGEGNGVLGPSDRGDVYPKQSLSGTGTIGGLSVKCMTPQALVDFHTGYSPRRQDIVDVEMLCKTFDIPVPPEYKDMF